MCDWFFWQKDVGKDLYTKHLQFEIITNNPKLKVNAVISFVNEDMKIIIFPPIFFFLIYGSNSFTP